MSPWGAWLLDVLYIAPNGTVTGWYIVTAVRTQWGQPAFEDVRVMLEMSR